MKIKIHNLTAFFVVVASVVLLGTVDGAIINKWFVMGEQTIEVPPIPRGDKATGRAMKQDVKKVKLSVEFADFQMIKVVLGWDNCPYYTLPVGTIKAGGQTAPKDAPGLKGRLTSVKIRQ